MDQKFTWQLKVKINSGFIYQIDVRCYFYSALTHGSYSFYTANTPCLPLRRKQSPVRQISAFKYSPVCRTGCLTTVEGLRLPGGVLMRPNGRRRAEPGLMGDEHARLSRRAGRARMEEVAEGDVASGLAHLLS